MFKAIMKYIIAQKESHLLVSRGSEELLSQHQVLADRPYQTALRVAFTDSDIRLCRTSTNFKSNSRTELLLA